MVGQAEQHQWNSDRQDPELVRLQQHRQPRQAARQETGIPVGRCDTQVQMMEACPGVMFPGVCPEPPVTDIIEDIDGVLQQDDSEGRKDDEDKRLTGTARQQPDGCTGEHRNQVDRRVKRLPPADSNSLRLLHGGRFRQVSAQAVAVAACGKYACSACRNQSWCWRSESITFW